MIEFTFRVNTNVVKNKATSSSSCRNQRHLGSNNKILSFLGHCAFGHACVNEPKLMTH